MKHLLYVAVFGIMTSTSAFAQSQNNNTFVNPCERGPLPNVRIINSSHDQFEAFLQEVRPGMPASTASNIAYRLCDRMNLVGNSNGLTAELNALLREYGY